jgi:hypothetical protein
MNVRELQNKIIENDQSSSDESGFDQMEISE